MADNPRFVKRGKNGKARISLLNNFKHSFFAVFSKIKSKKVLTKQGSCDIIIKLLKVLSGDSRFRPWSV